MALNDGHRNIHSYFPAVLWRTKGLANQSLSLNRHLLMLGRRELHRHWRLEEVLLNDQRLVSDLDHRLYINKVALRLQINSLCNAVVLIVAIDKYNNYLIIKNNNVIDLMLLITMIT